MRSCRGKPSNNERQEVSRFHSSEETSVMEVERRDEQTKRSRPTLIVTVKPGLIELKDVYTNRKLTSIRRLTGERNEKGIQTHVKITR